MLLPKKLSKGDKIGFFSPSSAATNWAPTRFERSKKYLTEKGFELVEGSLTGKSDFYRSGSIKERAEEFNALIRNPEVRCIISTIGGMNSNSIVPYIDYEALKKDPKIIIGYSDVTAILFAIYSQIELVTFYGPALVASFGEMSPFVDWTFHYFSKVAIEPIVPYHVVNPVSWTDQKINWEAQQDPKAQIENKLVTINGGKATGRLIVGNLNTMLGIFGSPFMPSIRPGDILLLEDGMKTPEIIERSFAHLKLNGVFDRIGGLILGKHELFNDEGSGRKPCEILMEVIGAVPYPILAEYDCAHTHPMITLPIGIQVQLDADEQQLCLLEAWTQS